MSTRRRPKKTKGIVRVEVQAAAGDAPLIRELAAVLRSGERRAAEVRSLLRSLRPRKSLRELLLMEVDIPDDVIDGAFARPRDPGPFKK